MIDAPGATAPADRPDGIVWRADDAHLARSVTARFLRRHGLADRSALAERAVADPDWFWDAVVHFLDIPFATPYTRVRNTDAGLPWTTWFDGGHLNLASACVDRWADDPQHAERTALVREGEDGTVDELTFAELAAEVRAIAGGLVAAGVEPGDRVALLLGLGDAAVTFLAIAHLGAVALPVFSGFGAPAVAARLLDGRCRLLVTCDEVSRRGRTVELRSVADAAAAEAASCGVPVEVVDLGALRSPTGQPAPPPHRTAAEDPVLLAYTSGTTGRPKGAVHVHGGLTVKLAQEGAFQCDLQPGDRAMWVTDMGWIMGPWITVAALANGATLVTYDGAPDWPDAGRLWSLVERHALTFVGVSPSLVRALADAGDDRPANHDLSSLRAFGSTGEAWNPEPWWWLFETVGQRRLPIVNLSGGTEIGACLLSVDLLQGLTPCSVGTPALGVPVDVVDAEGRSISGSGQVGELVVRGPWPGMTRGIWGDPARYLETYWDRFAGVWTHGDWAEVDDDGFWFLHGRSDDTLNIAGKRIGPAEIESVAVGVSGVRSAAAVGLPHPVKGEVVGLWCVRGTGAPDEDDGDDDVLARKVSDAVAAAVGKPFRPAVVRFVDQLPQTRSAKIVRRAVRARATGADPGDLSTLENPASLDAIVPEHLT